MVSRANLLKTAVRPAMAAKLMLSGVSGAGKTWSALSIARELVGPDGTIDVIDTEEESALTYADEHRFQHLAWTPPYHPKELADTIVDIDGQHRDNPLEHCIIVDSATHFWKGEGGTLDIANGKFTGWAEATPAQEDMVHSFLKARCHVIVCVREKTEYIVTEDSNGKQKISKVGMTPTQRDGLDYEFNVAISMDTSHTLQVHKTRCRVLADRTFRPHHELEMAALYRDWLAGGQPLISPDKAAELIGRVKALPHDDTLGDESIRRRAITDLKDTFGMVNDLLAVDVEEYEALVASYEQEANPDTEPAPTVEGLIEAGLVARGIPEDGDPDGTDDTDHAGAG